MSALSQPLHSTPHVPQHRLPPTHNALPSLPHPPQLTMLVSGCLFLLGAGLQAGAHSLTQLILGRCVLGFGVGEWLRCLASCCCLESVRWEAHSSQPPLTSSPCLAAADPWHLRTHNPSHACWLIVRRHRRLRGARLHF